MDFGRIKSSVMLLCAIVLVLFTAFIMCNDESENIKVDDKALDYAKGSICGYCTYCKFCKLCDADCPCETSARQPNCKMCKYCKYCYLCKGVCDTICTPGGILDKVSAAIVNSLPSANHDEIKEDLDAVKTWIDKTKDEL